MFTITVESTHKPSSAVSTAHAVVRVTGTVPAHEAVSAGLAALHEPRERLTDWGIDGVVGEFTHITDTTVVVYARRD